MTATRSNRRAIGLVALLVATCALAAGAWVLRNGLQEMQAERRNATTLQARLNAARALAPEMARREAHAVQAGDVVAQSQRLGFDPARWGERRVLRTAAAMGRREASDLLQQVGAGGSQGLFVADSFELSVLSRDAGLFEPPAADDKGLTLAMNGVLYFPLSTPLLP